MAWAPHPNRWDEFLGIVLRLIGRHQPRHLLLFLDNYSTRMAKRVQRDLADLTDYKDLVTRICKADYTQALNFIKRYWGHIRDKASNHYCFETIDNLRAANDKTLSALNSGERHQMALSLNTG